MEADYIKISKEINQAIDKAEEAFKVSIRALDRCTSDIKAAEEFLQKRCFFDFVYRPLIKSGQPEITLHWMKSADYKHFRLVVFDHGPNPKATVLLETKVHLKLYAYSYLAEFLTAIAERSLEYTNKKGNMDISIFP